MITLHDALKTNKDVGPGFHLLRHLLATAILAHHCRIAIIGTGTESGYVKGIALSSQALSQMTGGQIVVELLRPGLYALLGMFFALSGFLVTGSAIRNDSIRIFFTNRALRILPALTVEVTLSALVLGPLFTTLTLERYFSDYHLFRYFGNIVGHVSFQLPGVFLQNPWPDMVNANLWTLPIEFWCYLLMLGFMAAGILTHRKRLTVAILAGLLLAIALGVYDPVMFSVRHDATHFANWYIVSMFFFGVLFYVNASTIPLHPALFIACALSYYLLTVFDHLGALSGFLLTYCVVYIGMQRFDWFDRILRRDMSYGIYLYGFPITQSVVALAQSSLLQHSSTLGIVILFPVVLVLTCAFSALSWDFIEKPALGLRKYILRSPKPRAAGV